MFDAKLRPLIEPPLNAAGRAIAAYAAEVRARRFPGPQHVFAETAPDAEKTSK